MRAGWQVCTAALVGLAGAAVAHVGTGEREAPEIAFRLTGMSPIEVHGGSVVVLAPADGGDPSAIAGELEDRGIGDARVAGGVVELELPMTSRDGAGAVADSLVSNGEVAFHWVSSDGEVTRRIGERELPPGIRAQPDRWFHDASGRSFTDTYLRGSREDLERFIATIEPGPGHRFALEDRGDGSWRTYYIEAGALLDHRAIADARVSINQTTGWPEVLVDFTREGGERFARETGANIGRKLAIMRGDVVASAPVVQDRIVGGRTSITMGGDRMAAAETLASLLDNGPLDHPVKLVDIVRLQQAPIAGAARLAKTLFALAVGLALFALVWLIARFAGGAGREVESAGRSPWGRLAVTAGGLGLIGIARNIQAPGMDLEIAGIGATPNLSIIGLGLAPVIAAFIAVELVALAIPALRSRRRDPARRRRLDVAVAILAVALAIAGGILVRRWLVAIEWAPLAEPGMRPAILTVITLATGVLFLVVAAGQISRHGLGNGYAVVIGGAVVWELLGVYRTIAGSAAAPGPLAMPVPPAYATPIASEIAVYAIATLAAIAATVWILRSARGSVPRPTAGIVALPHPGALAAIAAVMTAGRLEPWRWFRIGDLGLATNPLPWLYLALVAIATVGLSLAFVGRVAAGATRALPSAADRETRRRELARALAASVAYIMMIGGLDLAMSRYAAPLYAGGAVIAVVATAVVMDLAGEWRFRRHHGAVVAVWPLHRLADVDLALAELERREIPAFARSRCFRALFHVFAPFAPVEIMVQAGDAERGREVCNSIHSP